MSVWTSAIFFQGFRWIDYSILRTMHFTFLEMYLLTCSLFAKVLLMLHLPSNFYHRWIGDAENIYYYVALLMIKVVHIWTNMRLHNFSCKFIFFYFILSLGRGVTAIIQESYLVSIPGDYIFIWDEIDSHEWIFLGDHLYGMGLTHGGECCTRSHVIGASVACSHESIPHYLFGMRWVGSSCLGWDEIDSSGRVLHLLM